MPGQTHYGRHDLTARVFRQKPIKLMDAITKGRAFRATLCWMYSVEWQKRGLPHAHILVWLQNKIRSDQRDSIISAGFPDPQQGPSLFWIIVKNMIYDPCGSINPASVCMENGKCTKKYPRNFIEATQTADDGYPLYRRRKEENGDVKARIKMKRGYSTQEIEIDNR